MTEPMVSTGAALDICPEGLSRAKLFFLFAHYLRRAVQQEAGFLQMLRAGYEGYQQMHAESQLL